MPSSDEAPSLRKCPVWLIGGSVPRREWNDPEVEEFLKRGQPVVLTGGCPLIRSLVGKWTFEYLARSYGDYEQLNVHFAPQGTTTFSRHYGQGLGKGGCTAMSFARFVSLVKDDYLDPAANGKNVNSVSAPPLRYYLQTPMLWNDAGRESNDPHGLAEGSDSDRPLAKAPYGADVDTDMRSMGWEWFARMRDVAACHPFDTCQLWAGHGGGATPLHFDSIHNFLSQVAGRKQVLLFPPAQTWNLYPYAVGHPMDNFSMVDVEAPDVGRFPALARARALEAELAPGEVLWLPRFWWHYVKQLDAPSENLSLNFWCGRKGTEAFMRALREAPLPTADEVDVAARAALATTEEASASAAARDRLEREDEALLAADDQLAFHCLQLGRMIEGAAVKVMGDDRPRGYLFLAALAAGADARWPPSASVARAHARKIRAECMAVLGGARAANALLRMISRDGRLSPGLAPPVEGDVVNSEKGGVTPAEEVERWFAARAKKRT